MTSPLPHTKPLRIVFFGMRCAFSVPPLRALITAGHEIVAMVLPGPPFGPPILFQPSPRSIPLTMEHQSPLEIDSLAERASIPVLNTGDLHHPEVASKLKKYDPDLIVVACFPRLIPSSILDIPRLGCLNVHPSLLPRGRGPEPLFWTIRRGEPETGVTIHLMDERFDAGPILAQGNREISLGIRLPDLEQQLAELGGKLLLKAIDELQSGNADPIPQNDDEATYAPIPSETDYRITTNFPARWAYNFVRAVAPTTDRLRVVDLATNRTFPVADAIGLNESGSPEFAGEIAENRVTIAFKFGSVKFVLANEIDPLS